MIVGHTISTGATVAPHSVMATVVSSTVISVQWDGLDPCRHVNGLIVLYRVQYTEVASGVVQSKDEAGEWNVMNAETSLTGLTPSTSYSIQVAAVNEEGDVGLYSDLLIVQTESKFDLMILTSVLYFYIIYVCNIPITGTCTHNVGIYLSLNDDIIPSHGYVVISDIGSTDDTALICHTNRPATLNNNADSGGDWFAPDETRVDDNAVPGFRRNRGPMMVRLLRDTATDPPSEGIYHCLVEDDTLTEQTVYMGLYNSGRGIYSYTGTTISVSYEIPKT